MEILTNTLFEGKGSIDVIPYQRLADFPPARYAQLKTFSLAIDMECLVYWPIL